MYTHGLLRSEMKQIFTSAGSFCSVHHMSLRSHPFVKQSQQQIARRWQGALHSSLKSRTTLSKFS